MWNLHNLTVEVLGAKAQAVRNDATYHCVKVKLEQGLLAFTIVTGHDYGREALSYRLHRANQPYIPNDGDASKSALPMTLAPAPHPDAKLGPFIYTSPCMKRCPLDSKTALAHQSSNCKFLAC